MMRLLKTLVATPAVRAFALSTALWLLLFTYSHYAFWRDPHGAYFHSEHVYDLGYTAVRRQEARGFLEHYSKPSRNETIVHLAGDSPALCAAIVTVRREGPEASRYFSDAVGSALEGLSPRERAALNLTVLFANAADPAVHPDYTAPWLSRLVDHAAGYEGLSDAQLAELRRLEETRDFQRKGVIDYTYVLEHCYNTTTAPYIAVFEDDIVFAPDWLARTLLGLQHLATAKIEPAWLYLRLFYSETYMEWNAEHDWLYGHLAMTLALVCFTSAVVLVALRLLLGLLSRPPKRDNTRTKSWMSTGLGLRLDIPTILVLSVIVAPAFTVLLFMAGKYNLPMYALHGTSQSVGSLVPGPQAWRRKSGVVPMDRQGCCSQALVFDRARVPELVTYLRRRERGQTDLMIEEYCGETKLRRFALGEQAVQHVGVVSSRGSTAIDAQSVWAFYFEENSADKLKTRHRDTLEHIDWGVF